MSEISFHPITESNLPLLHQWQNQPHLHPYYQRRQPISLAEITDHYLPRIIGEHKTYGYLAIANDKSFGYFQCYRNADHAEYAAQVGLSDGISLDFYIGDPLMLGKGWGRKSLKAFVENVVFRLFPQESKCYVWHNLQNRTALNCSQAAGFRFVREVAENGISGALLARHNTN